ncbi:MAG: Ankyrin [Gemmatimonadetes bacterium]|nr:Ankyrin [Gemmatimonadota bacterium]
MSFDSLGDAVRRNDLEELARLLAEPEVRARLNGPMPGGAFGATAIHAAVERQHRAMIELLLGAGADINQTSHWWAGGFHVLETADPGIVPFLLERGAVMNIQAAARHGRLDDVERILRDDPAAVHARAGDGQTALHRAATVDIARALLDGGAAIDALDVDHESTPAQYLVREHPDVVRYLLLRGARADILLASAVGDLGRVQAFVREDPESVRVTVSARDFPMRNPNAGGTIYIWTLGANKGPHVVAHEFGHEGILGFLMDHTPESLRLAVACELGDEAAAGALLAATPDLLSALGDDARRTIVSAAERDDMRAVRLMLEVGWPADVLRNDGVTALHWAAHNGNAEMVRALVQRGAPVDVKDVMYGATPLGWAVHGSQFGAARPLADYAAVMDILSVRAK